MCDNSNMVLISSSLENFRLAKLDKHQIMATTIITLEDVRALEAKEEQEESILAMLGIIGTFLNLFVIVFVYIYTTL